MCCDSVSLPVDGGPHWVVENSITPDVIGLAVVWDDMYITSLTLHCFELCLF